MLVPPPDLGAPARGRLVVRLLVGDGGLLTTAADLLKRNLSLDRASGEWGAVFRTLQTPAKLRDGRELDDGWGLTSAEAGGVKEISPGGATSGYKTWLARFAERRVSFARLGNAGAFNPAPAAHALTRRRLGLPAPPAPKRSDITGTHRPRWPDCLTPRRPTTCCGSRSPRENGSAPAASGCRSG